MKSFIVVVEKNKTIIGYEVLAPNRRVTNTYLKEGYYIAFDEGSEDLDTNNLPFYISILYENKILYISTRFLGNTNILT